MKVTEKTDYGFLFDSLNKNAGGNLGFDLSDYASIKNGSYGKLLKAYYVQKSEEEAKVKESASDKKDKKTDTVANEKVQELTAVATKASALQDVTGKLTEKGGKSLFKEIEIETVDENGESVVKTGYDTDAIYKAVSDFASKYNSFVKAMDTADSDVIDRSLTGFTNVAGGYKSSLSNVGITINEDNTLSVDEKKFMASDMEKVKSLFNGNASFAYAASTKASMIGVTANSEANAMKNYNSSGNYSESFSTGNLLNSLI